MIAQAASGAIITVAVADGQAGPQRLIDALIGAGVALVFTLVLFSRSRSLCCAARRERPWPTWPTA